MSLDILDDMFVEIPNFEDCDENCQGMDTLIEIRRLMKEGKEAPSLDPLHVGIESFCVKFQNPPEVYLTQPVAKL